MPHRIRAAQAAQQYVLRALTSHGLADPLTLMLLAAAATAAARAWEAGHRVTDVHPSPRTAPGTPARGCSAQTLRSP